MSHAPEPQADALTNHRRPLPALTGIRFFAAFYVVLFHSLPWALKRYNLPGPLQTFFHNGYLSVALFFLLSGFILSYTYQGQIEGGAKRLHFWQARFSRIYPVYLLSLLLAYYFQRALPLTSKIAVLAMVQAWNPLQPGLAGAWNYPAWSLSVEAFFYLLFPFVLPAISRLSKSTLVILLVLSLAICVLARTPIRGLGTWDAFLPLAFLPLPVIRFPEFLSGMILGIWLLRKDPSPAQNGYSLRVPLAVVAALLLLSAPIGSWISLVILPFAVLVYDLAARPSVLARFLSTRTMLLLGGASYSVYLLQYPVRSWVRLIFSNLSAPLASLGAPLTPLILVLFSILIYLTWEEPSRHALRRWFSPRPARSSSAQTD